MKSICYLVLAFNNYDDTVETINSIKKQRNYNADIDILVVDNNSIPKFAKPLCKFCEKNCIQYIYRNINDGYAGGNNFGWNLIKDKYKYIFVVNNDIIINNVDLSIKLVSILENDNKIGIAGPVVYYGNNERLTDKGIRRIFFNYFYEIKLIKTQDYEECDSVIGCFLALNPKNISSPLFDDSFFMYGEELNLGLRTWKEGYKVIHLTDDEYSIYHKGGCNPFGNGSIWKFYLSIRNSILCSRQLNKNRGIYIFLIFVSVLRTYFKFNYLRNQRRAALKGFISGIKLLNKDKNSISFDAQEALQGKF
ncbi:glycosyltransferase family 2 protein [Treponema sp. C6A8]|uniref:glycosyltransferase family 2 protein n=1 Tax=Treponema sp. C6A8 TaxID=1410609 RepID=UPI00048902D3|nr:glycosyltransferase [Treponema sp. C6A8]